MTREHEYAMRSPGGSLLLRIELCRDRYGMRVWKERWGVPAGGGDSVGGGSGELDDPNPSIEVLSREVYKYDGQMMSKIPMQSGVQQTNQAWTEGQPGGISHTQFVPGLRGVGCSFTPDGKVNWFLYDGHGSVVATVDGLGTGQNWGEVPNVRHYDVWGNQRGTTVRGTTGQPTHGYCGNLGHTKDADLGNLIYMRARYYEPCTGRFVCEDPGRDGANWYVYAACNPVCYADASGKEPTWLQKLGMWAFAVWAWFVGVNFPGSGLPPRLGPGAEPIRIQRDLRPEHQDERPKDDNEMKLIRLYQWQSAAYVAAAVSCVPLILMAAAWSRRADVFGAYVAFGMAGL